DLKRPAADLERAAPEMVIVGRRQLHSNNSWMHNLPVLAKGLAPTALVNPQDAARLGLEDGGKARIERGDRMVEGEVEITDEMMPGVVRRRDGWGHDRPGTGMGVAATKPGANLNQLMNEDRRDPLSGTSVLSGMEVRLEKVATPLIFAEQTG